jgi:hypothetical protein
MANSLAHSPRKAVRFAFTNPASPSAVRHPPPAPLGTARQAGHALPDLPCPRAARASEPARSGGPNIAGRWSGAAGRPWPTGAAGTEPRATRGLVRHDRGAPARSGAAWRRSAEALRCRSASPRASGPTGQRAWGGRHRELRPGRAPKLSDQGFRTFCGPLPSCGRMGPGVSGGGGRPPPSTRALRPRHRQLEARGYSLSSQSMISDGSGVTVAAAGPVRGASETTRVSGATASSLRGGGGGSGIGKRSEVAARDSRAIGGGSGDATPRSRSFGAGLLSVWVRSTGGRGRSWSEGLCRVSIGGATPAAAASPTGSGARDSRGSTDPSARSTVASEEKAGPLPVLGRRDER